MLERLRADYTDRVHWFYIDVPFEETQRRHAAKPEVDAYGEQELRAWWNEHDVLPGGIEHVFSSEHTREEMVAHIVLASGLRQRPPIHGL